MGIGLGLVCLGAALMVVALAALAICGIVALVERLRELGPARYARVERHGRAAAPAPAGTATPSRARFI